MDEKDLYAPTKILFENLGFEVYGEVRSVDLVAYREDTVVAVELKKDLNLQLIAQGATRQRLTDYVYLAIPMPTARVRKGRAFKDKIFIARRLGLGLIYVTLGKNEKSEIVHEPNMIDIKASQQRNKRKRLALHKEVQERLGDYNIGGSKGKIMTAYKEAALKALYVMRDGDVYKSSDICKKTANKKATNLLYKNYYGWFKRAGHGCYTLTPKGVTAIDDYQEHLKIIAKALEESEVL